MHARQLDPKTDLRAGFDRFTPEGMQHNQPIMDLLKRVRREEERDACPNRAGVADGAEAVDRSDPRHAQLGSPEREHGAINVQLTPADLREIETAFSKLSVHGGRMNEMQMRVVDQTT